MTFQRVKASHDTKFVIFSDFHITNYRNDCNVLPNYFLDHALDTLYVQLLDYYLDGGYVLVENGDVEDCVMYQPGTDDAKARLDAMKKATFPIRENQEWAAFLDIRYDARFVSLSHILNSTRMAPFYAKTREFIRRGK